jgi:DNA segregation ATPase FtsK/SpoIIIE-like protein
MQIRLTVLGPRGGGRSGRPDRSGDVLVTAPAGTVLAAVAAALAGTGSGGPATLPALYAGARRLDPRTALLGVPPLVDGAVLSLHAPADEHAAPPPGTVAAARLLVTGGPDAGGVHLLRGGRVVVGRSADADVPLDDPDVSRLHCALTVEPDGAVTVADLGSTNGTSVDGRPVGTGPVPLPPGALLRAGESLLTVEPATTPPASVPAVPDADGHLRVPVPPAAWPDHIPQFGPAGAGADAPAAYGTSPAAEQSAEQSPEQAADDADPASGPDAHSAADGPDSAAGGEGWAAPAHPYPSAPTTHGTGRAGQAGQAERAGDAGRRAATPLSGTPLPGAAEPETHPGTAEPGGRRTGGVRVIGAWARRLGTRRPGAPVAAPGAPAAATAATAPAAVASGAVGGGGADETAAARARHPDPAAVLLTALGPGPRLWERAPGHADELAVRLGTVPGPAGAGPVPYVVRLGAAEPGDCTGGALGLVGPRPRLAGLARAVLAQVCALHAPSALDVVLLSADRTRAPEQRAGEWGWLHWLPHLRPAHGQECRLLTAYDREQAEARTAELVRRVADGPLGAEWASAGPEAIAAAAARRGPGPHTLLVVDGDPGSAYLREAVVRLATAGPASGLRVLCLAESADRLAVPCATVAALEGEVATALRVWRPDGPPEGDAVRVEAVSAAWADRFGRALAPLREGETGASAPSAGALPERARLLDVLDLSLATPAKVSARWAALAAGNGPGAPGALPLTLGSGPRGPVTVDLAAEGPHLLIGGAPGSGKTELLRAVAASLAAAAPPDRLALLLVDGGGQERGEGLRACTELPHVTGYLSANDPLRMREFAQAVAAELKRRAELLGGAEYPARAATTPAAHTAHTAHPHAGAAHSATRPLGTVPRQGASARPANAPDAPDAADSAGDPAAALPRLVLLVDDFEALAAPALGAPGRPAAGSVLRALEAVARDGGRLGVHLVAATGRPERTANTDAADAARLRIALRAADADASELLISVEDAAAVPESVPGRGYLRRPSGAVGAFQAGRVTGRIPRTATLRPTVVPLDWARMGDPPTRRPLRELGNGPTDLALLASALQRAADPAPARNAP